MAARKFQALWVCQQRGRLVKELEGDKEPNSFQLGVMFINRDKKSSPYYVSVYEKYMCVLRAHIIRNQNVLGFKKRELYKQTSKSTISRAGGEKHEP